MALPDKSSLSTLCVAVRDFVNNGINNIQVLIGTPAAAVSETEHCINLFFYRFEPGGFDSDIHPNDPWRIRMYCLITAFCHDEDSTYAGENDLRMLGEVMRIFHQTPVLELVAIGGETVQLQVVFRSLGDEQLNQVWSTQGDTAYRPSVIYEMALVPIMPSELRIPPPLAGSMGVETSADMGRRYAAAGGVVNDTPVPVVTVDISDPYWTPALAWVDGDRLAYHLLHNIDDGAFAPLVWIAGDSAADVDLVWEIWDQSYGWREAGATTRATPHSVTIDPNNIPDTALGIFPVTTALPPGPAAPAVWQAMLYARRKVKLEGQPSRQIRSNPLLISLYKGP